MTDRAETRKRWISAHCEQSRVDSCVAACMAMVHGLVHGLEPTAIVRLEATYIDRFPPDMRGVSLDRTRELGLLYQCMQDLSSAPEDTVADLEDRLRDGPLIVTVWSGPLRLAQGGSGWQPSDRLLHAIALSGHFRRKFLYLDPARPRTDQPLAIPYAAFLDAWTGELAFLPSSEG